MAADWRRAACVILAGAVSIAVFFRAQLGDGFSHVFGEPYDGNIAIAILEHWFRVFQGRAAWRVTGYFYLHPDTLGYNDGYVLYGVLYAPWRAIGCDPYLASDLVNMVVKATGFACFHLFARRALQMRFGWSLLGAALFTTANDSMVQASHVQLLAVAFAPLLALLVWQAGAAWASGFAVRAACWGCAASAFYGAWLLSTFYMAWFFGLFACLSACLAGVAALPGVGAPAWRLHRPHRPPVWPLLVVFACLALSVWPFVSVYLPKAAETGMHRFTAVRPFVPSVSDLLNVGPNNLIVGPLYGMWKIKAGVQAPDGGEAMVGFPPLLLLLALCGMARYGRANAQIPGWPRVLALATLLALILSVHLGGWMPWRLVYALVPGGKAVRVVSRFLIFLAGPVTLLAMLYAAHLTRHWRGWQVALVAAALLLEQVNRAPPVFLNRRQENALIASIPAPPPGCHAFYARNRRLAPLNGPPALDALYHHNVDAMLIAAMTGLPTINGFSTFNPPDWNFADPARPDYLARVAGYAAAHRLGAGLCGLDLVHRRWITEPLPQMADPAGNGATEKDER